jgi:hypothetical protein
MKITTLHPVSSRTGKPIPENEQCCSWCGSKLKKVTRKIPIEQPTNEIVIRTQKPVDTYDEYGDLRTNVKQHLYKYVWDGVSYEELKHKHFCKDSCAIAFANAYMLKYFKINKKKGRED